MNGVGGTKWSLATAVLATRGLYMLSYSRGNLSLNVLDVKHILTLDFMALCQQFYTANTMHELFMKVKQEDILAFLRAATSYNFI